MEFTTLKIMGALIYAVGVSTIISVREEQDSYLQILRDPLLWAAAVIGLGLMLFVERTDSKVADMTAREVVFSIFAAAAFVFICVVVRAGMVETGEVVRRSYLFYIAILFLTSIAPELAKRLITTTPKSLTDGINKGIKARAEKMIGGDVRDPYSGHNNYYEDDGMVDTIEDDDQ